MTEEELKKILENECNISKVYCELSSDEIDNNIKLISSKLNISKDIALKLFNAYRAVQSVENWKDYTKNQFLKDNVGTYDYSDNFSSIEREREIAYSNYQNELVRAAQNSELNNILKKETFDFNLIKELKSFGISVGQLVDEELKKVWNLYEQFYVPLSKLNVELDKSILEEQSINKQLNDSLNSYSNYMDSGKLNEHFKSKKMDLYKSFVGHFKRMEKFTFFPKKVCNAISSILFVKNCEKIDDKFLSGERVSKYVPIFKIGDYVSSDRFDEKTICKGGFCKELSEKVESIKNKDFSSAFNQIEKSEINFEYLEELFKNNINPSTINDFNLKSLYELYISLNKKIQEVELIREYNIKTNDAIIKVLSELAAIETSYQDDVYLTFNDPINALLDTKPHFLKKILYSKKEYFDVDYNTFRNEIKQFSSSTRNGLFNEKLIGVKDKSRNLKKRKSDMNISQYFYQYVSKHQNNIGDDSVVKTDIVSKKTK